ncbi:amino acid adenylation domain-containing protein [Fulvivirga sp. 29W222]|uniref:Amino acid adenylation domain-containing protein n=1 Tax=Fulvivirga marina TaxID=2494733 RepID=A0A937KGE5_9BACT|nr:non-ribosomal peptide synthetase [Fulvivirga marina]MBL6449330.1 amino acid adenylation domain-containing protein [Fulvivirga marina]
MRIDQFITSLRNNHNIILSVDQGSMKIKASKKDLTDKILNEIKEKKSEILDFFNQVRKPEHVISQVKQQDHYPISFAQRRLWILDQVVEVDGVYNVPVVYSFSSLDIDAFERAFDKLLDRHEVLRTTIHTIEGEPRQKVHEIKDFNFAIERSKRSETDIDELVKQEMFQPLNLSVSPVRATLVERPDDSFVLILVLHHIVTDEWSMKVLLNDFLEYYYHFKDGKSLFLPPLAFQYKDYTSWQLKQLKEGKLHESRNYWLQNLSGELLEIELPVDSKREKVKNYQGGAVSFDIGSDHVRKLTGLANKHDSTLFTVLVGIVNVLLHKYTNQKDILIGTPVTGRDTPELENQVGYYGNTIVLRNHIAENTCFTEFLKSVRDVVLAGFEHQYYPFDLLVDELNVKRNLNQNPLFDVMLSYVDSSRYISSADKKTSDTIESVDNGVNKFDLTFSFIRDKNQSLGVIINYNKGLFKKEKMMRMAGHLRMLLQNIATNPDLPIERIGMLTEGEVQQISKQFNCQDSSIQYETSIKSLIEAQAEKRPDQVAVVSEYKSYTFREINQAANQFAQRVRDNYSLHKHDHVVVVMRPDVDRLICLVGLIKLGIVYVPVDPDYPQERMQYIVDDAKPKLIICDEQIEQCMQKINTEIKGIDFTMICSGVGEHEPANPEVQVLPDDIFAILYTSGSTGQPKGVLIKNRGLINRMSWLWNAYNFSEADLIYQKTPYVFDVSIGELYMPLCYGAKLFIADDNSSERVYNNILKYGITYVHFSPTLLNQFLGLDNLDALSSSLRFVFSSGEALLKETVKRYYAVMNIPLINLYGPTEASIEVSCYEAKADDDIIPIGKPLPNVKLYIIDEKAQLLPVGVAGEIAIGGVALAEGYLNSIEKTNERFIADEHSGVANARLYKTGDRGRWNESGMIEYLGRFDNQLSLWGARIEPGEIETALLGHPAIQEVAVVPKKDDYDNDHLVAFYVEKSTKVDTSSPAPLPVEIKDAEGFEDEIQPVEHGSSIMQMFDEAVQLYPNRIAVISQGEQLTYEQFDSEVNKLAKYLALELKVGKGDLVSILMNRSENTIVAILALIKVGAVYVPVDPSTPDAQLNYILADTEAKLLISDTENRTRGMEGVPVLVYDGTVPETDEEDHSFNTANDGDLCYVCYTSGTTGKPKGVMVEHRSVVDYISTFKAYFQLEVKNSVLQQSSLAFDTAVEEIFPTLCTGATLIVLPNGGRDIDAIIDAINTYPHAVLSTTPLVVNEINNRVDELTVLPEIIISGGDELRPSFIDQLVDKVKLYNTYGPTETTVCASFARIVHTSMSNVIGKSIPNHQIYLLNDQMKPVAHGEVGEMYIAGVGVTRGYLNREQETHENFLPNPFGESRMYRTGDLARKNDQGLLVFCGRKDRQAKVRGYRVEPMAVDHALKELGFAANTYTTTKVDGDDVKQLVTYFISSKNEPDTGELREALSGKLPPYMVPAYFIKVDDFPKTVNGKIDEEALPLPPMMSEKTGRGYEFKNYLKGKLPVYMIPTYFFKLDELPLLPSGKVDRKLLQKEKIASHKSKQVKEPKNELERSLLTIWQNILKTSVSTDDNFFESGGNSIKATQIISAVYKELGYDLTLKDLFNNASISELALVLEQNNQSKDLLCKLGSIIDNRPEIFFVPPIIGSSTVFMNLARHLEQQFNIYGLQYKGFDHEATFDISIEEMASSMADEIVRINRDPRHVIVAGYSMGVPVAYEMTKILESLGYTVDLFIIDRGTGRGNSQLQQGEIDKILERELQAWLEQIKLPDMERIKKLVYHNYQLLNKYSPSGSVAADIIAIEASLNINSTEMERWRPFTSGGFHCHYIETSHHRLLQPENVKEVTDLMSRRSHKFQSESHIIT